MFIEVIRILLELLGVAMLVMLFCGWSWCECGKERVEWLRDYDKGKGGVR